MSSTIGGSSPPSFVHSEKFHLSFIFRSFCTKWALATKCTLPLPPYCVQTGIRTLDLVIENPLPVPLHHRPGYEPWTLWLRIHCRYHYTTDRDTNPGPCDWESTAGTTTPQSRIPTYICRTVSYKGDFQGLARYKTGEYFSKSKNGAIWLEK